MARLHAHYGRKGTSMEYYEYKIVNPKVIAQRCGDKWWLAVEHFDGTWQAVCAFPRADDARMVARKLAGHYATASFEHISDYVKAAQDIGEQYAYLTTTGVAGATAEGAHA